MRRICHRPQVGWGAGKTVVCPLFPYFRPRYGRVLADLLVEGTHTVDDITARLAGLGAAPSEVLPPLDMLFQGGLLDAEVAPS